MTHKRNTFELKLLTSCAKIGLRRLRSYSASIGGAAKIFRSYEDLIANLDTPRNTSAIVLLDDTVPLEESQRAHLYSLARVFHLERPEASPHDIVHALPDHSTSGESFFQCNLDRFLDSPVIRICMAHMCRPSTDFRLPRLLRWGAAEQVWTPGTEGNVSEAGFAFIRQINLTGVRRRMIEMFSHFLSAHLAQFSLDPREVRFGSDGLLCAATAICHPTNDKVSLEPLLRELEVNDFPMTAINMHPDGSVELGVMHHISESPNERPVIMVFRKRHHGAGESSPGGSHLDPAV